MAPRRRAPRPRFAFPHALYPIVDAAPGRDVLALTDAVLGAGVAFLQLRAKDTPTAALVELARAVKARADRAGARLIINDRTDVARLIGAAGVHLGQDDLPPTAARAMLGPEAVIGFSTHNADQLDAALRDGGMDYLAFGPIFATVNKRDPDPVQGLAALAVARARCPLPLVAIGGIDGATLADVLASGADAAAVIGAINSAADPHAATRALLAAAHGA